MSRLIALRGQFRRPRVCPLLEQQRTFLEMSSENVGR
jgi:hypothetical protein